MQRFFQQLFLKAEIWLIARKKPSTRLSIEHFLIRLLLLKFRARTFFTLYLPKSIEPFELNHSKKYMSCSCVNINGNVSTIILDIINGQVSNTINCNPNQTILLGDRGLLYTKTNEKGRQNQIWYRPMISQGNGTTSDKLLLQTDLKYSSLKMSLSRDKQYVIITNSTRLFTEVYTLSVSSYLSVPEVSLVCPLTEGIQYFIDHAHDRFYMITNNSGSEGGYKILSSTSNTPLLEWDEFYSPESDFVLQDVEFFSDFIALFGNTRDMKPVVKLINPISNNRNNPDIIRSMVFDNQTLINNCSQSYYSDRCMISVQSPLRPETLYAIPSNREHKLSIPSPANDRYIISRESARNEDGTNIPITVFHKRGIERNGTHPLLMLVYGSHGVPVYMGYKESISSLLRRGWIVAFCHVRGGNELGLNRFYQATGNQKYLTIEDTYSCIMHLHDEGYSTPNRTAIFGKSSGGLAVGNVCNMWPHLIRAAILEMPYVNLYDSLSRNDNVSTLIDCLDKQEFGDPVSSTQNETMIKSLCPYHNLSPKDYPSFLVLASCTDEVVDINHVDQYVLKLRLCINKYKNSFEKKETHHNDCQFIRGNVLYEKYPNASHYETMFNHRFNLKQEELKTLFLLRTIGK